MFDHERVVIERGSRSGLPIVVAVHSTALGQAIGGCRMASYPDWRDGLADALRLSEAMSAKCALAGLPTGGGKTVIVMSPGASRREVLLDVGDAIERLGGAYATGPDVGTGPDDMTVIGERTSHVFCRPESAGGSGDSSGHTATGVLAALRAVCAERFGSADFGGRTFALLGVGRVGAHIGRALAGAGGVLIAADVDRERSAAVPAATWVSPGECLTAEVDVLIPAALGGVLTAASVASLRCAAVVGPANNQLDRPETASLLHERGILWAPDVVVSAGGIIHAIGAELLGETAVRIGARLAGIGDTVAGIFREAREAGISPSEAADRRAGRLLTP